MKKICIGIAVCMFFSFALVMVFNNYTYANSTQTSQSESNHESKNVEKYKQIKSKDDVKKYSENVQMKNKQLVEKGSSNVTATITFSKPISYTELEQYIKSNNLNNEVKAVGFRALQGEKRITGFSKYSDDMRKEVNDSIAKLNKDQETKFIGYINMYVVLKNSSSIGKIQSDDLTYLLDPSGDADLTIQEQDQFAHPLTWILEDMNLLGKE